GFLRVGAEHPGERPVVTPRDKAIGIEFYCPLDRTLFLTREGRRVAAKMSKSHGNTIGIFETGKPLKKKVMGIETRLCELADPLDPDEDIVFQLYALFADRDEQEEMRARYRAGGYGFGNAKKALLAKIEESMEPFRSRRAELEADPGYVDDVLARGARTARAVARETLDRARTACGLGAVRS
ncbi:MAG: hypothetical protein ACO3RU_13515, partial [Planctomycetota bacterium]